MLNPNRSGSRKAGGPALGVHVVATLDRATWSEYSVADSPLVNGILQEPFALDQGCLAVPTGPGLGVVLGGRLGYVDDGETANTQILYHDYAKAPLIFEVRGLPSSKASKEMDKLKGAGVGVIVECEGGSVVVPSYSQAIAYEGMPHNICDAAPDRCVDLAGHMLPNVFVRRGATDTPGDLARVLGAVLGILMMIPLRRYLIVKEHGVLTYPEGTACAEVLIAGVREPAAMPRDARAGSPISRRALRELDSGYWSVVVIGLVTLLPTDGSPGWIPVFRYAETGMTAVGHRLEPGSGAARVALPPR